MRIQELVSKSLIQALLAVALTLLVGVLVALGREVPAQIWDLLLIAWGFYFGATLTANNHRR